MDWIKNNKNIIFKIFSIILYAGAMLIYEFLFCNGALIIGEGTNFNFSFVRLVIYISLGFVYIKFINQSTEEAIKSLKSKGKIGLIALVCIAFSIVIAYFIYKQVYFYKIILTIITFIMSVIALLYLSNNHIKNILIIFMTLGILFCCTTQLNGSLDEKRHFMSAFNISVGNLNYKKNNISEESIEKIPRVCPLNESMKFFGEKYENKKFENNDTDVDQKPSNYNFIIYLPSAIGISLAKILGGSIADIYIVGRIFNLLAYMLLLMAIIKVLPFKKNVFFVSYLLPIIILLAGSYSIDGMCIGIVGLFIAYCLKLYKDPQEVKAKQIFKLAILFALSLLAKEMSYLFICLLILMMPLGKIIKENKKPMIIATIGVILVMLVLVKSIFFGEDHALVSDPRSAGTDVKQQLQFIVNNPGNDVKVAINHIKGTFFNFQWLAYINPANFFGEASTVIIAQLIFLLYVGISENDFKFKIKEKVIIVLSFLGVFATGSLVLYLSFTPVGHDMIQGYQTRYIFPVLPLILMIVNNNNQDNSKRKKENIAIITTLFMIIDLIGSILFI